MVYKQTCVFLFLIWIICIIPTPVMAASLKVSWKTNSEADLAGYTVYYGNASGKYVACIDVGNVTSHTIANVTQGKTYYIVLSAYDRSGNESANSQEVSAYVPVAATSTSTSTTPNFQLLSPIVGSVLSTTPTLNWTATSLTSFTLYMALNNGSYNKMYSGTKKSYQIPTSLWCWFIPSGSTIKWYVVGVGSSGNQVRSVIGHFKKR